MTGEDLRLNDLSPGTRPMEVGQVILLTLARNGPGFFNCSGAGTFDQSIPRLAGPDDPLVPAVETLIRVTQAPDRALRVTQLQGALVQADRRASLPLLASLRRRALLASGTPELFAAVGKFLADDSPIVRQAAAETLSAMLAAARKPEKAEAGPSWADSLLKQLRLSLDAPRPADLAARVATIAALGELGRVLGPDHPAVFPDDLDPTAGPLAERAAWLRALATAKPAGREAIALSAAADLPLDAPDFLSHATARALVAFYSPANPVAPDLLSRRAEARLAAGLDAAAEIEALGLLPADVAAPALIALSRWPLSPAERVALARSAEAVPTPALIPVLTGLIGSSRPEVRAAAQDALMKVDTDEAARALWPALEQEFDAARKLRLAAFLGRHGFRGGYAVAIEHLADPTLRELAVAALADIRHPDAPAELRRILDRSNDLGWNAAAIRALGRLDATDLAASWLNLARDPSHPLAPAALIALADLGSPDLLPLLPSALDARGDAVVIAAARAFGRLKAGPETIGHPEVVSRLARLLADRQSPLPVREAALDALLSHDAPELPAALGEAVRDASLEGTPFLSRVESLARSRRVDLPLLGLAWFLGC
jgi:HEAT repeat protein